MQALIALIGILIASLGLFFVVRPNMFRRTLNFFLKVNWLYAFGAMRVVFGIIFLIFANKCVHSWLIIFFGIMLIVTSIVIFSLDTNKLKKTLRWWLKQNKVVIRLPATMAFIIGLLIAYGAIIQWP